MKRYLLILSFFALTAHGQEKYLSIQGVVTDGQTGEPVAYASVFVKGQPQGTLSNEDGRFRLYLSPGLTQDTLVLSAIGYERLALVVGSLLGKDAALKLKPSSIQLAEIVVHATDKELSAKEIVKKAVSRIPQNYPMEPFAIEGFFRDLQLENGQPVELLEAAVKFYAKDYNPGYETVDVVEVRKSFNRRHPINGNYDRQNSIIDLMEDNYVKHRFGPIGVKGWKFAIDSVMRYDRSIVFKISGRKSPSETAVLFIDTESFAILRIELRERMVNGEFYRRYLNLPDPYGQQETSFTMLFEFREFEGKLYLKYQREEDTYNLFNKTTNAVILKQSFMKELFVNNVIVHETEVPNQTMNMNRSVEGQAKPYNEAFWKYYNAPVETAKESVILKALNDMESKP